jgi:hypothetical protein
MSDFHSDDTFLRASAYLDGELDAAESALAEADPAVMAEVEILRALQDDVRDVEPPTAGARERAIGAALAEFGAIRPSIQPTVVAPFRPRPAYTRWIAVAAAVVGIGLLGVIVATAGRDGDNGDAGQVAFEATAEVTADGAGAAATSSPAAPLPESLAATDQATVLQADAAGAEEASEATVPAAIEAPEPTEAPAATERAADDAESITASGAPPFDPSVPIADDVALRVAGIRLIEQLNSPSPAPTPDSPCDDDPDRPRTLLSEATYMRDGVPVPILIAIDKTNADIIAVDPSTCDVIAVGR